MLARMCDLLRPVVKDVRVVAASAAYEGRGAEVLPDRWPGEGPLGGIITALEDARTRAASMKHSLIVRCDMPVLTGAWLRYLVERALKSPASVVVPKSAQGLEPLCACWRTSAAGRLQHAF